MNERDTGGGRRMGCSKGKGELESGRFYQKSDLVGSKIGGTLHGYNWKRPSRSREMGYGHQNEGVAPTEK